MEPNQRRCVSCRKVDRKQAFWRIVRVYPDDEIQLDEGMGRSAYLCPQADCLKAAQKKNRLGRSLKASVAPSIYEKLWSRLKEVDDPSLTQPRAKSES
ncbi:YlxR family protein [Roseofilum capinflatum]|uniref:YlxR family protein n=1 Tax=Roseofilum capinflatum BLCC-M114 TaxID=3022440 RepID=A0ABT7BAF9_9CYAN|nr:YlxR family protein [Roseofilum capinflatum]MDJ1175579.1 YlxR family protein [Roseofilum capinflatum BLCC-M114]